MLLLFSLSATLLTMLTLLNLLTFLVVSSLARDVASLQTAVALLIVNRPHEHPETTTNHHQEDVMLPLDHIIVTTIPRTHAYRCGFCRTPLPLDAWDACPCRSPQAPPSSWKTRFERPEPQEHDLSDIKPQRDPLSTARGILVGVALSLVAWAAGILAFMALWR